LTLRLRYGYLRLRCPVTFVVAVTRLPRLRCHVTVVAVTFTLPTLRLRFGYVRWLRTFTFWFVYGYTHFTFAPTGYVATVYTLRYGCCPGYAVTVLRLLVTLLRLYVTRCVYTRLFYAFLRLIYVYPRYVYVCARWTFVTFTVGCTRWFAFTFPFCYRCWFAFYTFTRRWLRYVGYGCLHVAFTTFVLPFVTHVAHARFTRLRTFWLRLHTRLFRTYTFTYFTFTRYVGWLRLPVTLVTVGRVTVRLFAFVTLHYVCYTFTTVVTRCGWYVRTRCVWLRCLRIYVWLRCCIYGLLRTVTRLVDVTLLVGFVPRLFDLRLLRLITLLPLRYRSTHAYVGFDRFVITLVLLFTFTLRVLRFVVVATGLRLLRYGFTRFTGSGYVVCYTRTVYVAHYRTLVVAFGYVLRCLVYVTRLRHVCRLR